MIHLTASGLIRPLRAGETAPDRSDYSFYRLLNSDCLLQEVLDEARKKVLPSSYWR